jgi:hypothetical protein
MTERDRQIIQQLRETALFNDLFAAGITPDDLKSALVAQFAPYFEKDEALHQYVIERMVPAAASLSSIAEQRWAMGLFQDALRVQRNALRTNRPASLQCLSNHLETVNNALTIFWSQYHLRRDIDALNLEEFVHEVLRIIGTIIEGPVKPLLYYLVHQARITRGAHPTSEVIRALTLGNLVEELLQQATDPRHLTFSGLRLNQWRNIAQHLTARVRGHTIVCEYNDGQAQVELHRSELRQVLVEILAAYKALKVAHSVVFFDCVDEIYAGGMLPQPELRAEASLVVLVSALASQGFEVLQYAWTPEQSRLVVRDVSTLDPDRRRVHSTQFVIPLFFERPAEELIVEYWERDGTPSLRTTAGRALIDRAQRENDWNLVARECQFTNRKPTK